MTFKFKILFALAILAVLSCFVKIFLSAIFIVGAAIIGIFWAGLIVYFILKS